MCKRLTYMGFTKGIGIVGGVKVRDLFWQYWANFKLLTFTIYFDLNLRRNSLNQITIKMR